MGDAPNTFRSQLAHPATVLSAAALFLAAGGAPVLADTAASAKRLVTGQSVKDGSLAEKDLSRAVRGKLNRAGARGAAGPAGAPGAQGPAGARGSDGANGANGSNATINGVAAGGDLTGTYPNPQLGALTVGASELDENSVSSFKIVDFSIGASDVGLEKLTTHHFGKSGTVTAGASVSGGACLEETTATGDTNVEPDIVVIYPDDGVGAVEWTHFVSDSTAAGSFNTRFCNTSGTAQNRPAFNWALIETTVD